MQHLDEGTIHAWLDGQLPRDEADVIEAHVAACRPCADAVAEARGLIAASSRILTALDGVPRRVVPVPAPESANAPVGDAVTSSAAAPRTAPAGAPPSAPARELAREHARERARRRWFSGPTLAAAATLLVAVGTFAVVRREKPEAVLRDEVASASRASGPSAENAPTTVSPLPSAAATTVPAAPAAAPPAANVSIDASAPPVVANEAQAAGVAGQRRALADGSLTQERARLAQTAPSPVQSSPQSQVDAVAQSRADLQRQAPGAREAREQSVALRDEQAKQAAPATRARPDTVTVQVFRGTARQERAFADSTRAATLAKTSADAPNATGGVSGRIADGNGTPLRGAMVTVAGTPIGVSTDTTGVFTLSGVPAGPQQIVVRYAGYQQSARRVTIAAGHEAAADFTLSPAPQTLGAVAAAGAAAPRRVEESRANAAGAPVRSSVPSVTTPGATPAPAAPPAPAASAADLAARGQATTAHGCYDLGITPTSAQSRTGFRDVPRRIALDSAQAPGRSDGVWYQARDLTRGGVAGWVWRPSSADGIELQMTAGTRLLTVRLTGAGSAVLRGTVEEIDRATASGEAGTVVAARRACTGG